MLIEFAYAVIFGALVLALVRYHFALSAEKVKNKKVAEEIASLADELEQAVARVKMDRARAERVQVSALRHEAELQCLLDAVHAQDIKRLALVNAEQRAATYLKACRARGKPALSVVQPVARTAV